MISFKNDWTKVQMYLGQSSQAEDETLLGLNINKPKPKGILRSVNDSEAVLYKYCINNDKKFLKLQFENLQDKTVRTMRIVTRLNFIILKLKRKKQKTFFGLANEGPRESLLLQIFF